MSAVRLMYPDYVSGGLEAYYLGAQLMERILPANPNQKTLKVEVTPPAAGEKPEVTDGIYGRERVAAGIASAAGLLEENQPDRVITIGGNCAVSFAPFDYLKGKYESLGIIWIDAHPDVSVKENGYPCAHAMVLGSLLGKGDAVFTDYRKNAAFAASDLLYVGLQGLHDYQAAFLDGLGVNYRIQKESILSEEEIRAFASRFDHVLVHFDIDALDPVLFRATYFANPDLVGDGSGGGRMTLEELGRVLKAVGDASDIVGLTVAEYLHFEAEKLQKTLSALKIFSE